MGADLGEVVEVPRGWSRRILCRSTTRYARVLSTQRSMQRVAYCPSRLEPKYCEDIAKLSTRVNSREDAQYATALYVEH